MYKCICVVQTKEQMLIHIIWDISLASYTSSKSGFNNVKLYTHSREKNKKKKEQAWHIYWWWLWYHQIWMMKIANHKLWSVNHILRITHSINHSIVIISKAKCSSNNEQIYKEKCHHTKITVKNNWQKKSLNVETHTKKNPPSRHEISSE